MCFNAITWFHVVSVIFFPIKVLITDMKPCTKVYPESLSVNHFHKNDYL